MTETARSQPGVSFAVIMSAWHDPAARILNIDLVTVLIAILLPWSTTGVVIAAVLWVAALVPTLEVGAFLRSLKRPICLLPIAMFALALAGTLWSEAPWGERLYAVGPTVKLLMLPLLLYHLRTLAARRVGVHSLSGVLRAADGGVHGSPTSTPIFRSRPISRAGRIFP